MEIQACLHNRDPSGFPQWRSKLVPKTHYAMEIQGGSHNGDPSRFPQCVSALVGDLRPHPPLYEERCPAIAWRVHKIYKRIANMKQGSRGNGDPSVFTRSRSKPVPTTEIQTGPQNTLHNGDPSQFTQRRSKAVCFAQCVSAPGG